MRNVKGFTPLEVHTKGVAFPLLSCSSPCFLAKARMGRKQERGESKKGRLLLTGFTLIEMLIVVSIMALILATAAPAFIYFQRRLKLTAAANNIATGLRTARSYAITKHGEYAVDFDLAEDRFVVVYPDPADPTKRTIVEKRFKPPENIDIFVDASSFPKITISDPNDPDDGETLYRAAFKSTGAYNGKNGDDIWIKDAHGKGKRISVMSTTGAVKIEDETPPS